MKHYNYWWSEEQNPHNLVFEVVGHLTDNQGYHSTNNINHARLYGNISYRDLGSGGMMQRAKTSAKNRVTLNIIQSMCDTVTARVAKAKPMATYLTSGGDWEMQRKAKRLTKFTSGQFYGSKIYEVAPKVFLDACVFGTGVMKIFEHDGEIKCERVFPDEIVVDDLEARYGNPRQMFQRKVVDKQVLASLFPEFAEDIHNASSVEDDDTLYRASEQIECIEAWHLPSSKDAKDGRHVIAIENATLMDDSWERDDFPFAFIRWTNRLLGFFGQGLAEQLTGIQVEINRLLRNIQQQMHLATPKVFVESGSKISKAHINNEIWGVIEYAGTPPQFFVPKTVSGEIFSHLDRLFNRAYEIAGVSQLAAGAKKPAGLESGVALREFQDIESERFLMVAKAYEQLFLDAADQMIDIAREVSARGESFEVISQGDDDIEKIKWADIDLERNEYVMKVYPTSLLPTTPAAKLQKVIEMLQAGMLTQQEARALLDYPDLEAVNNMATASQELFNMMIERILEKGIYQAPEPYMNLSMGIAMMQSAYLRAKINSVPETRLDLFRRFIEDSIALLARMQAQAAPPPMEAMGPGPATPQQGAPPAGMTDEVAAAEMAAAPIPTA
jgi:hypothetical protein|tara:strand:- start:7 stop:1845 length:1839 start_codon:yes stop_codon:yes gene_type:complete